MQPFYPRINVETTFDKAVREYGGVVVREKLPYSPHFENADYIFHFEKIVCELKCLTEDNLSSPNNDIRAKNLINEYYGAGLIDSRNVDEANWAKWPRELQTKIYEATTRSIKRRLQKANTQIHQTKAELKLDEYRGLVVLVNDGIYSLTPAAFIHATQLVLAKKRRQFSQIDYFVYVTANLFTLMRGVPLPVRFWIGVDMEKGPKMDTAFVDRLGSIFKTIASAEAKIPIIEQKLRDMEGFWKAKHIKI